MEGEPSNVLAASEAVLWVEQNSEGPSPGKGIVAKPQAKSEHRFSEWEGESSSTEADETEPEAVQGRQALTTHENKYAHIRSKSSKKRKQQAKRAKNRDDEAALLEGMQMAKEGSQTCTCEKRQEVKKYREEHTVKPVEQVQEDRKEAKEPIGKQEVGNREEASSSQQLMDKGTDDHSPAAAELRQDPEVEGAPEGVGSAATPAEQETQSRVAELMDSYAEIARCRGRIKRPKQRIQNQEAGGTDANQKLQEELQKLQDELLTKARAAEVEQCCTNW